jgi:hypothetical protein
VSSMLEKIPYRLRVQYGSVRRRYIQPQKRFHKFSKLPKELRLKVWQHALPAPRVVHVGYKNIGYMKFSWHDWDNESWTKICHGKALLLTCWEAHEVFIAGHHVLHDWQGDRNTGQKSSPPIYFKNDTDTLLMPRHCFCLPRLLNLDVSKVTKLAFFYEDLPHFGKCQMISLVERSFPAVKHVLIVHSLLEWHTHPEFPCRRSIHTKKLHLFSLNEEFLEVLRSSGISQHEITQRNVSRTLRYPQAAKDLVRWADIDCDVVILGYEVADSSQIYWDNEKRLESEHLAIQQEDLRSARCQLLTSESYDVRGRPVLKRTVYYRAEQWSKPFIEPFDKPERARKVTWLNQRARDKNEPLLYSYTKPRNHHEVWFTGPVPLICDEHGIPKTRGQYEGLGRMFAGDNVECEEQDERGVERRE